MRLSELFRAVYINIRENKVKVFLTTLGVIVGSFTIILVMAIGSGSQSDVEAQYKRLNVGTLQVMPAFGKDRPKKLTIKDVETIRENSPSLKNITIMTRGNATASFSGTSNSVSLLGVTSEYGVITNVDLAAGRYISADDNDTKQKVVVLGYTVAQLFWPSDVTQAIGQKLVLNGKRFEVIGVMNASGQTSGMTSDEGVVVPYQVAIKFVTGRGPGGMSEVIALAKDINHVDTATTEIQASLEKIYHGKSGSFMIRDAGSSLVSARASAKTMTLMLFSVAVVVLIVGGIGIMNVLYVSVRERTKEIGILKSIGARRRDILLMFLLEAIMISLAGGVIGVVLGTASVPVVRLFGVTVVLTGSGYALALGFSMLVGTFFGYYPAAKAAAMKPIDALNYE